ncbi:hypothetical protein AVEN_267429-1 [Araneus ventricosus]|uniref:Uncharacterized protein n=1 Tax=Araneus ventricosus TaxID=182803 RepID=A0A4Y2M296_ARAVE|nr:hypothetical protein AVEN_267429-1 [Araneus ventricosus]
MAVHALIHTTGVVFGKKYVPLELAYLDVTGYEIHFLLNSPYSYTEAIQQFPHASPDVLMTTCRGMALDNVLHFLRLRHQQLQETFPDTPIVFGCKGNSLQMDVLKQTNLPHLINVETLGVPSLKVLAQTFPHLVFPSCSWHVKFSKCARVAIRLIAAYVFQQNTILSVG